MAVQVDPAAALKEQITKFQDATNAAKSEQTKIKDVQESIKHEFGKMFSVDSVKTEPKLIKISGKKSARKNEHSVKELVTVQLQKGGEHSKGDLAVGCLKSGYQTPSDTETFVSVVYTNGIYPLIKEEKVEAVGERGNTKYRWKK